MLGFNIMPVFCFQENVTDTEESMKESYVDDIPRFNALCRGEELRPAK